jgi:hypothetical protein
MLRKSWKNSLYKRSFGAVSYARWPGAGAFAGQTLATYKLSSYR